MQDQPVVSEVEESGIGTIRFNRPDSLNALDVATAEAFAVAAREMERARVRCVLLVGAGRSFSAGGDVAAFGRDPASTTAVANALLDALHPALLALRQGDAPVIAAVQGVAAGAGLSIALSADLVIAAEDTRFLLAYDRIGASPDGGSTWFLPRKVGRARAAELMLLGATLSAAEALDWGLINRVVAPEALGEAALAMARQVAAGPTRAYGSFRRLIDAATTSPLAAQLEAERAGFIATAATADFREGTSAFLEKRKARFEGK